MALIIFLWSFEISLSFGVGEGDIVSIRSENNSFIKFIANINTPKNIKTVTIPVVSRLAPSIKLLVFKFI